MRGTPAEFAGIGRLWLRVYDFNQERDVSGPGESMGMETSVKMAEHGFSQKLSSYRCIFRAHR
jgi:hypothetical protein